MKLTNKTLNSQYTTDCLSITTSRDTVKEKACMEAAIVPGKIYRALMNTIGYASYVFAVESDEYVRASRVYDAAFAAALGGSRAKHKAAVAALATHKHLRDNPAFVPATPALLAA